MANNALPSWSALFEQGLNWCTVFDKNHPITFTVWSFWAFFMLVMVGMALIGKKLAMRNTFLFAVSLFFYFKTSGFFFLLLVFSTVTDFYIGQRIAAAPGQVKKTGWLSVSVFINLISLFYFKYTYFLADAYSQATGIPLVVRNWLGDWANQGLEALAPIFHWNDQFLATAYFGADDIILPVGVSFFTFQTISYAADLYRGRLKPVTRLMDFGFYVAYFPQLVAGPIVRAAEFIPQIYQPYRLSKRLFGLAIFLILSGMAKKVILADYLAVGLVDKTFSLPEMVKGFEVFFSLLVYSLQVYADFSGYTDMAIGVALLMGFKLPLNFNSPYKAENVADFWKRWHISLSTWLKDYLYIPLGGNRKATWGTFIWSFVLTGVVAAIAHEWRLLPAVAFIFLIWYLLGLWKPTIWRHFITNINMLLTMLIGGLWHGASWNFMIWGGLNGLALVVYKYWRKISPYEHSTHWAIRVWKIAITFIFISLTRLFFRAGDVKNTEDTVATARTLWHQMADVTGWTPSYIFAVIDGLIWVSLVFVLGMILHWLPTTWKRAMKLRFISLPGYAQICLSILIFLVIYQFALADAQTFIYFQF